MLDDFDVLSEIQQESIIQAVGSSCSSAGVWICERPQLLRRTVIKGTTEKESNSEKVHKIVKEISAPYIAEEIEQDFKAVDINILNVHDQKIGESEDRSIALAVTEAIFSTSFFKNPNPQGSAKLLKEYLPSQTTLAVTSNPVNPKTTRRSSTISSTSDM